MKEIIDVIGQPAMLEMLAEECTELGHAALKMARYLRKENPTPDTELTCIAHLIEECADVEWCIDQITGIVDSITVENLKEYKQQRACKRLGIED